MFNERIIIMAGSFNSNFGINMSQRVTAAAVYQKKLEADARQAMKFITGKISADTSYRDDNRTDEVSYENGTVSSVYHEEHSETARRTAQLNADTTKAADKLKAINKQIAPVTPVLSDNGSVLRQAAGDTKNNSPASKKIGFNLSLTSDDLLNGIIMSEVLGRPKCRLRNKSQDSRR